MMGLIPEGLGENQSRLLSRASYAAIIIFTASVALEQLELGTQTVTSIVKILTGGIAFATALAVGLGSKDHVARWWEKRRKTR